MRLTATRDPQDPDVQSGKLAATQTVESYGDSRAPAGGNLVNSVRIAALSERIAEGAPGVVIRTAALALDDIDRHFLADTATSRPFWDLAADALLPERPQVHAMLQSVVQADRGPDPGAETYTVVAGDTMRLIAERLLGERARWREIAAANPRVDPDRLAPGDVLVLP